MTHFGRQSHVEQTEQTVIANDTSDSQRIRRSVLAKFHWTGDRFGHRIEMTDDSATLQMQTVPCDSTQDWPDNPPVQQLSIEPINGQFTALGVGLAGSSHWSLSVEGLSGSRPQLRYDLACRCTMLPERLLCRYLSSDEKSLFSVDNEGAELSNGSTGSRLCLRAEPSIGPVHFQSTPNGRTLSVFADLQGIRRNSQPQTVRWGFSISILTR